MTRGRFTSKISGTIFLIVFLTVIFLSGTAAPVFHDMTFQGSIREGTLFATETPVTTRTASAEKNVRTASAEKEGIIVRAELTPNAPLLTDDLTMTLFAEHSPEFNIQMPDWGGKYGDFEVLETLPAENAINNGRQISQFQIRLRPTRSGTLSLPPIPLTAVQSGSDLKVSLLIPPGKIGIRSEYENKTANLGDIHDPFGIIKRHAPMILLAVAVLILLTGALIFILKRKKTAVTIAQPVIPPSERALSELQLLMDQKVYVHDVRDFYLKITGIVRWFIEQTTGLKAPEQTTEEFLTSLTRDKKKSGIFSESMKNHLKKFLEFSDLVKFAKFRPTLDEIFDAYNNAKFVIEASSEQPEPNESPEILKTSKVSEIQESPEILKESEVSEISGASKQISGQWQEKQSGQQDPSISTLKEQKTSEKILNAAEPPQLKEQQKAQNFSEPLELNSPDENRRKEGGAR